MTFSSGLSSIPSGVALFSNPAVSDDKGRIQRECKPGENLRMRITIENNSKDGSIIVFKRHVLLWDTGMFKLMDKNSGRVRVNYHIQPKGNDNYN